MNGFRMSEKRNLLFIAGACLGRVPDDRGLQQGLPALHQGRGQAGHRGRTVLLGLVLCSQVIL